MSSFDPTNFMGATFTGANDTKVIPVPINDYDAQIDKVEYQPMQIKTGDRIGQTMHKVNVFWKLSAPGVEEADGKIVRQEIILEMTENGGIDMGKGKNVKLGKLREATGLNDPTQAFGFGMLMGQMAKVSTTLDADKDDPTVQYARVKAVHPR